MGKAWYNKHHIVGIDHDASTLAYARKHQIAHEVNHDPSPYFEHVDVIVLALYPKQILSWVKTHASLLGPKTVLTDVSGVKDFHETLLSYLPYKANYLSMHPMAGKEKVGIMHATERLFQEANFIVIEHAFLLDETTNILKRLIFDLGSSKIITLSPPRHDALIAYVSQLTHAIAIALVNADIYEETAQVTGDSFRDLTRIANINEVLWSELMLENKESLLQNINRFMLELTYLKETLIQENSDKLQTLMKHATTKRGSY